MSKQSEQPVVCLRSPGKLGMMVVDVAELIAQKEEREEDEEGLEGLEGLEWAALVSR